MQINKPFHSFFVSMVFIFSTMYGLYYYYQVGASEKLAVEGLEESGASFGGFINIILDLVSWLSPFALVKYMVLIILPSELYLFVDLFFLRPIGWIGTFITTNYLISKIPTVSGE